MKNKKLRVQTLSAEIFLNQSANGKIVDVRSPSEYESGHIPGAFSLPLFSDDERAVIGTIYKQIGKKEAILEGLEIVGKKMKNIAQKAYEISKGKSLFVHCWRGGMRSKSMAQLFENIGIECFVLNGGYKAYRNLILLDFKKSYKFIVLGGKTGSGKTQVLQQLYNMGEQVLDLEKLASHKGSAFGSIGEMKQPTTEQFGNDLHKILTLFDSKKRIWLEDESHKIGTVFIPFEFYINYRKCPLIVLDISLEKRLQNLVKIYGNYSKEEIIKSFEKISKKIGGQNVIAAKELLHQNNLKDAAAIALYYYDKAYIYGLQNKDTKQIEYMNFENEDTLQIAKKLIETANVKFS
ncbi:MAG: tRNA 2-selenouridine(34) synthase MnmH [Bacteroidetes bacterium]|nr:tRNA 2-selenouridine(34) synthase MnmH [Bacteroidota bacterium]